MYHWVLRIIVDLSPRVFVGELSVGEDWNCCAYKCTLCMLLSVHVCCALVSFEEYEDKNFEQGRKKDHHGNA